jgi:hypothetical protein
MSEVSYRNIFEKYATMAAVRNTLARCWYMASCCNLNFVRYLMLVRLVLKLRHAIFQNPEIYHAAACDCNVHACLDLRHGNSVRLKNSQNETQLTMNIL